MTNWSTSTSRLFDAARGCHCRWARSVVDVDFNFDSGARSSFAAGLVVLCEFCPSQFVCSGPSRTLPPPRVDGPLDDELIDTGPYRLIRHPLYSATIGAFAGIGAVLGNWVSVGMALMPTLALLRRVKVEEDMLLDALGVEYDEYRNRSMRLIPWVW